MKTATTARVKTVTTEGPDRTLSDPHGQFSDLPVEESPLNQSPVAGEYADSLSDSQYFEDWLENLKSCSEPGAEPTHPGEIKFEGTLRVDGYAAGFLSSLTGTLIIGESGKLEADLIVATAIIDGFLRGNIHATENVVLGSHARVFGDIESPALSIQTGAVFEGQCHFLSPPYKANHEDEGLTGSNTPAFSSPNLPCQDEEEAESMAVTASS